MLFIRSAAFIEIQIENNSHYPVLVDKGSNYINVALRHKMILYYQDKINNNNSLNIRNKKICVLENAPRL